MASLLKADTAPTVDGSVHTIADPFFDSDPSGRKSKSKAGQLAQPLLFALGS